MLTVLREFHAFGYQAVPGAVVPPEVSRSWPPSYVRTRIDGGSLAWARQPAHCETFLCSNPTTLTNPTTKSGAVIEGDFCTACWEDLQRQVAEVMAMVTAAKELAARLERGDTLGVIG